MENKGRNYYIFRYFFLVPVIFLFASCHKNADADYPTVRFIAPAGIQTFNVFDTIKVQGFVSDKQTLTVVSVCLENSASVVVLPAVSIPIGSNDFNFSCSYILNDQQLASGVYYLTLMASNGVNTSYTYQQINVDAAPTKRTGIYALTRQGGNTKIWNIDSNFHVLSGALITGNYSGSDINSAYQQLYVSASDSGNAIALSMPSGSIAWSQTGTYSPIPYFTGIYSYGNAAYLAYYNGIIKYINSQGNLQQQFTIASGYYPIHLLAYNNYLFVEEKNIASSNEQIGVYYQQNAIGFGQNNLPGPIVAMYGADVQDIFVFGNQTGGSVYLLLYNFITGLFNAPVNLPAANVLSAAQISSASYLVGLDNGTIYYYTYNPVNFIPCTSGINASHIVYDNADNEVIASSGKKVCEYAFNTGTLIRSVTLPDSVLNVLVLYNK
jgi:hypothetical protein